MKPIARWRVCACGGRFTVGRRKRDGSVRIYVGHTLPTCEAFQTNLATFVERDEVERVYGHEKAAELFGE